MEDEMEALMVEIGRLDAIQSDPKWPARTRRLARQRMFRLELKLRSLRLRKEREGGR